MTAIIITLILALFVWALFKVDKTKDDGYPWWEEE